MRRLGIFSFYDREGIVDSYIEYLLRDLKRNLNYLIITVNGKVNSIGKEIFDKYADLVLTRENKGFDCGAYKDVLVDIIGEDELKKWDEIVLCNDTFYGPFIAFEKIFKEMEPKAIDFWGLNYIDQGFLSHIQSFFLVFRTNTRLGTDLFAYFKNNINSQTEELEEVLATFENGLFLHLVRRGYKYNAYTHIDTCNLYRNPDVCVKKYKLPILKKRSFAFNDINGKSLMIALHYIQLEWNYELSFIIENAYRLYDVFIDKNEIESGTYIVNEKVEKSLPKCILDKEILRFIHNYDEIYIYGTGFFARKIWYLYHDYMRNFKGFIISDDQTDGRNDLFDYPVTHYHDVKAGSALMLGMGCNNSKMVFPNLKAEDNVLLIWESLKSNENLEGCKHIF